MFIKMKELKQMLFDERMRSMNEAEERQWSRDRMIESYASVDDLRKEMHEHIKILNEDFSKQIELLNKRIEELETMIEQKTSEDQKAVNEYDQA